MSQLNKINFKYFKNKLPITVLYSAICFYSSPLYSQKLSFNKLRIGTHIQQTVESTYWYNNQYTIKGLAAELGFCSSIIGTTFRQDKKVKIGEYLGGELRAGYASPTNFKIWNGYLFDIGGSLLWDVSESQQIKFNVLFLKFGSDLLIPNISGSGIAAEYRFRKLILSTELIANNDRFTGWVKGFNPNSKNRHIMGMKSGLELYVRNDIWVGGDFSIFPINQNIFVHDFKTIYSSYSIKLFLCKRF